MLPKDLDPTELLAILRESTITLIDLRSKEAFDAEHIEGAQQRQAAPGEHVVFYCDRGVRSASALEHRLSQNLGDTAHLVGGLRAWRAAGFALRSSEQLSDLARARYARQITLPGFGPAAQSRLSRSRVLIAGVGGLGSPAALYLAGAGVGTLGLVDFDEVSLDNLHRQVLYRESDVGHSKVQRAKSALAELNSEISIEVYETRVSEDSIAELLDHEWDVVLSCLDNLAARYVLHDAALKRGIPFVHGAVDRFFGEVMLVQPGGPCFRCLHPVPEGESPRPTFVQPCAEAGVLGATAGLVGTAQALEAIKVLTETGDLLLGRLWTLDATSLRTKSYKVRPPRECPFCGTG